MIPIRRLAWIEAILFLFILLAGATIAVTRARYTTQHKAFDGARVARPVLRLCRLSDSVDLGVLSPGNSAEFEFTVDNGSLETGVSEVALEYEMAFQIQSLAQLRWEFSLQWLDRDGVAHACIPKGNGIYPGFESLAPSLTSHHYRLSIALPPDATLPEQPEAHAFEIVVTAHQRNG